MIIVAGWLRVAPENRAPYLETCPEVIAAARSAEGCIDFHLSADALDVERINVFEQWESADAATKKQDDGMDASMKSMKLYDRIHNELALLEIDAEAPLTVDQLTPFDNYHYFGTEAVDEAIRTLGLKPGMRVLDIGSGIGGPARYIAERSGAHVTALELQPDLDNLAADFTRRCGLADLVEHRCGDILDGLDETYDAVVHPWDRERYLERG